MQEKKREGLLTPYRILDLTDDRGYLCGKILADLGADVIKVERPGGDPSRTIGTFYHNVSDPEKNLNWFNYNVNKRGITINIEVPDGRDIFKKLVKTADFVIESFPPDYLDSIGLNYESLSKVNPKIILTSITPFGQTGPYKNYQASDLILTSLSGIQYITGDPDRAPLRCSLEQAYLHASSWGAIGSLTALHQRELTGEGQHVDVSALESMVAVSASTIIGNWDLLKSIIIREGNRTIRGNISVRLIWPCKDGHVCWRIFTGAQLGQQTVNVVSIMDEKGKAGWLKDVDWKAEDMTTVTQEKWNKWEEAFSDYFLLHSKAELFQEALSREVLLVPVNTAEDIIEDPHLKARDFWVNVSYPEMNTSLDHTGSPFKLSEFPYTIHRRAPLIGEHNREIFNGELGLSDNELLSLKKVGAI